MTPKYELYFMDTRSVLVVTPKGALRRLYCPFPALCIKETYDLKAETNVAVEAVKSLSGEASFMEFIIEGKAYHHSNFSIEIAL